jgi:hypothetical protein
MTPEELIKEIEQLPLERQREILDALSRSVRENRPLSEDPAAIVERLRGIAKPHGRAHGNVVSDAGNGGGTLSQRLYGILQFDGGPPTDEEVKDMLADYLIKKYY